MPRKGSGCLKMARVDSMVDTTRMGHRILYLNLIYKAETQVLILYQAT